MIASVFWLQSALNSFVNKNWFFNFCRKYLNPSTFTKEVLSILILWLCSSIHSDTFLLDYQFHGVPYSMRILYKTYFLTESYAPLTSINSWCTASLYYHFFSSIWRIQNIWSILDLLLGNAHWWHPIISSANGVNLDSRLLGKILYLGDKSTISFL